MESKKLVVGNMKMNLTMNEVKEYIESMTDYHDCVICPSSLFIPYFKDAGFVLGTQNISEYSNGAYTGEISVMQAKSLDIDYTIIGHSERREYFCETDEMINNKVIKALDNGLKVILCVGETLEERETGVTKDKIEKQILEDLKNINDNCYENIIVAYEPIWAIGTGKIPSEEDIIEIVELIKETVNNEYHFIPNVLYGGSTNEKNIEQLKDINIVDGFLVGGACLVPEKFKKIIEATR